MFTLIKAYQRSDPAAKSWMEVFFLYPGFRATLLHRIAHFGYCCGIPLIPRLLSEINRWMNGMDIHPGAQLGKNIVIDHGLGVVIGETAIIGDRCLIYHGVTLGSTQLKPGKRHPTLGNDVTVGAGAKILGNIVIGSRSKIGANSVVTRDIPPDSTAVGIPAVIVSKEIGTQFGFCYDYII